jgi:hypothetical protein
VNGTRIAAWCLKPELLLATLDIEVSLISKSTRAFV